MANPRAEAFLAIADQFQLGGLLTESSHPVTSRLSDIASKNVPTALQQLLAVDDDVVRTYRRVASSGVLESLARQVAERTGQGGKLFFTGCGSTGRLSIQLVAAWRRLWRKQGRPEIGERSHAVMAGGDFALIKSVEGFEDHTVFGRRQISELEVGPGDMTFAITEGGETSFVIGTAWEALERGADVVFVYNNPDEVLRGVQRSAEVLAEPCIRRLNLTTGPMAISGSTRMQATTIEQLCMLSVLELAARYLLGLPSDDVLKEITDGLDEAHSALRSFTFTERLADLVSMEEEVYRAGGRHNYFAKHLAIDVLTDTTERSPTFCTPPFRKWDDTTSAESWAFLFTPCPTSSDAWRRLLEREPRCVSWSPEEVSEMLKPDQVARAVEVISKISQTELHRFRIGMDGLATRPMRPGDSATGVLGPNESGAWLLEHLSAAQASGARIGLLTFGWAPELSGAAVAGLPLPGRARHHLLEPVTRATAKMALNALSTCIMVRLGRVMGNTMVWVVPSNLKLIDRSTRYVSRLTGLSYTDACHLLHDGIDYVAPRMATDRPYPPVVGLSVVRHRTGLDWPDAEQRLYRELGIAP